MTGAAAADQSASGEQLYEFHGCINCHGSEGKNPVSKLVPKLAGRPSQEIYQEATAILNAERVSGESKLMHAAFYSPSVCDYPPQDGEIRVIADWLNTR